MIRLIFLTALSGCTTLQSVSLTQIPAKRKNLIYAEADKLIFFGLNFDNKHVDVVKSKLISQCRKGLLTGVLTKSENHYYFGALLYKSKISASGYCM